ncbi:MAG: RNA polymerase sigma factor [Gemmatimonadota bacterium]
MQHIDRQLLDAAREGDRDAFEQIVRTHFRIAFATARSIVDDPADAEDVVQDAFVRCWQRLSQCSGPEAFAGWLRSVVRSVALNHIERERVRATRPLDEVHAAGPASPETDLDRALLADRLRAALRTLPQVQQEILLLHELEGFRHADIANLLGISTVMSRKHLSHARKRMRRALQSVEPHRRAVP